MEESIYDFLNLSDEELILFYSKWIKELKRRNLIRTKNIVGELGEYLAIKYYNKKQGLPKLQATPTSTRNIDAISIKGERYSIKTITCKTTGAFYGVEDNKEKLFEYVIVVVMNKDYTINKILELTWDSFMKHKHWHSRMKAWNLTLTKRLINDSKIIYSCNNQ